MSSYDSISWLLPEKSLLRISSEEFLVDSWGPSDWDQATRPVSSAALGFKLQPPGRKDLSYDLKSADDILKISEHFCCCLKKLSRHFPVWILHTTKGPHPDWAISEGHTKAEGLDEATLTVKGARNLCLQAEIIAGKS